MDPCNPDVDVENARSALRSNMGVPKAYAKNFSKKMICDAFKKCKRSNVFPPMEMKVVDGYVYLVDSNSPLTARDYRLLFEIGKKGDIIRIAKKLGVVELTKKTSELKADIISILDNMNILEPVKAMKVEKKKEMVIANQNLFNNNGNNNKNLFKTNNNGNNNNNKNLFKTNNNGNGNNKNLFKTNNNGNNNKNLFKTNNNGNSNNKNLFNNGNNKNSTPGRPVVKIPGARINANSNGTINNLRNFVKTPKVRGPLGNSKNKTNVTAIMKNIESIKNELGVPPPTTSVVPTASRSVMSTVVPTASRSAVSTVSGGQYTKNNLDRRSVDQLRRIGVSEFGLSSTAVRKGGYGKNRLVTNILNRQRTKLGSIREE